MNFNNQRVRFGFGGGLTPAVKYIIIANVAVYFVQMLFLLRTQTGIGSFLGLIPFEVTHHFKLWQLGTYLFLHSETSIFHIFFNMFTLWIFGCEVERWMGTKKFLQYYFLTGIGAGIIYTLIYWNSVNPVIGASGALYGVMVAFAVLFPNRIITLLLFFILPVSLKAKHLVALFIGISLFSGIIGFFGSGDRVAHIAHLGGAAVGFLALRGQVLLEKMIRAWKERQHERLMQAQKQRHQTIREKRDEVDRILDHINQVGYDKITDEEKSNLKKASEFLSREDKIW